ncbi:FAD dependent oxidoreductase [Cordyceps fumosorosea ARSEF 2679]|uniref:FAD dependent oxidoreductase n=1 Tax=Cordyceps fumosorosea (strain ARSEF 2679) TaxID=1081104 RepID=A0A162JMS0_CORFA|nr:FAD dependent oxidoreductase [Cordyceps fumosorosea ARSEF 2679]OAA71172.1 FAD dependent oxidoreductase [Cordyceps fumosorosea ARSEF 2679]
MAKSVCIVGAGPAGLAVAKTLLHNAPRGDFKVTVFDAQPDVGGLWPTSEADTGRQIHPLMLANQSRHTMHFSDQAWDDLTPQLPRAWMIGQYLQRYAAKYLTGNPDFQLNLKTRVMRTDKDGDGWNVTVQSDGVDKTTHFDRLIVASGYFGDPVIPKAWKENTAIPVIHSSQYRDLQSLLGTSAKGGKILVAGGQMSGVEIAATIGTHLSNEINSPDESSIHNIEKYSIHHVSPRHPWVIPLHTTPEPKWKAPPFLPHDFSSFNKNNRPVPFTDSQGHIPEERAKMVHGRLRASLGPRQRIGSETANPEIADDSLPPYLSCSDWYCDFVRSGFITVQNGRLESLAGSTAKLADSSIQDVAAVILATGFDPEPCIGFLPEDVLTTLKYSPAHPSNLLALSFHATQHPDVPNLGFVGFYRGAFWGVIQMQARFITALWSSKGPSDTLRAKLASDRSIARTLSLRDDPRQSQFPMGDYQFLMQDFAEALSLDINSPLVVDAPNLTTNKLPLEVFAPFRFSIPNEDGQDNVNAQKLMQDAATVLKDALTTPRFVSRAVFRSLLGTWELERDLTSKLPTHPSGHFSGTAQFLLRAITKEGVQCTTKEGVMPRCQDGESYEYLYIEDGEFKTDQGFGFRATRRYVYRYDEASGAITVWFAKPDDNKRVDYFFHEIEFEDPPVGGHMHGWPAKSGHLCIDDYYNVNYNFVFDSVNLESWVCAYTVNGPQKDYTIRGTYTR